MNNFISHNNTSFVKRFEIFFLELILHKQNIMMYLSTSQNVSDQYDQLVKITSSVHNQLYQLINNLNQLSVGQTTNSNLVTTEELKYLMVALADEFFLNLPNPIAEIWSKSVF